MTCVKATVYTNPKKSTPRSGVKGIQLESLIDSLIWKKYDIGLVKRLLESLCSMFFVSSILDNDVTQFYYDRDWDGVTRRR